MRRVLPCDEDNKTYLPWFVRGLLVRGIPLLNGRIYFSKGENVVGAAPNRELDELRNFRCLARERLVGERPQIQRHWVRD